MLNLKEANKNQHIWHEPFSKNLIFVFNEKPFYTFELMLQHHHSVEELSPHVINMISHQYKLSDRLYKILIEDNLIDDLEDKLILNHNWIKMRYLL